MKKHAILGPSSAERWMTCPGSVALCSTEGNTSSSYADEGTAAHYLAAVCLAEGTMPEQLIGKKIGLFDQGERFFDETCYLKAPPRAFFIVNETMAGHVETYVKRVLEYRTGGDLLVEQRLSIKHLTGEEDAYGTADAIVLNNRELQVHDLKFGQGMRVDADYNKQLMIYALAALEDLSFLEFEFDCVRLVIHQPRLEHLSEWYCSVEELRAFGEEVKKAAEATRKADAALVCGDHCKKAFCRAQATCPALAKFIEESIGAEFEDLSRITDMKGLVRRYAPEVLGSKMKAIDAIESWCTAVRAKVESVLLQSNNDADMIEMLGHKLVQGRQGARAWRDAAEAEAALKAMRLKVKEMYDLKLISPTACEKVLKETPKKWVKAQALITRSDGKPSVAPVSDKRPALVIESAEGGFDDLTGGGLI